MCFFRYLKSRFGPNLKFFFFDNCLNFLIFEFNLVIRVFGAYKYCKNIRPNQFWINITEYLIKLVSRIVLCIFAWISVRLSRYPCISIVT